MRVSDIPEIDRLSAPEKILLVENLRDSIASDESNAPAPRSHIEELDMRLKRYRSGAGNLLSLEDLRSRVENWASSEKRRRI